jgi:hypothetical protein
MPKRRNERLYMAMIGPLKKIVSASCVTEVAGALVELPCPCPGSSFFNKLKHFRGIATRYDKLARNFLAAVQLVDYHPAQLKTGPTQAEPPWTPSCQTQSPRHRADRPRKGKAHTRLEP